MNEGSKTNQQLFLEIEELRARLAVAQQRLEEANERTQAEMTECKRIEQVLEERLKFETLLAELSAHFINLPADKIDNEIVTAQRRLCELLDLDRSALWTISEDDPEVLVITHFHARPEFPAPLERINSKDCFPWIGQKVLSGETIFFQKISELPAEAARDRETHSRFGTKSFVAIPLSTGKGSVFGVLTFVVAREERDWPNRC